MSPKTSPPTIPTAAELEVLQILWTLGTATVRQVLESLPAAREVGYTTVLKTLQIMLGKGLVVRTGEERAHQYSAAHSRDAIERLLVQDLLRSGLQGSMSRLVMHALAVRREADDELERVERLIREARKKGKR